MNYSWKISDYLCSVYGNGLADLSSCSPDFLTIATTRPETLFGDVALAVHPEVGGDIFLFSLIIGSRQ